MAGNEDRVRKEFERMQELREKSLKTQKELEEGLGKYADVLKKIYQTQNDINHLKEQEKKAQDVLNKEEAKHAKKKEALEKKALKATDEKKKKIIEEIKLLDATLDIHKAKVGVIKDAIKYQNEELDTLKNSVKESNKLKAALKSTGGFLKGLSKGFGKLRTLGVFEMDKEIRNSARSLGIGAKQSKAFSANLQKAGEQTAYMGVSTKELAKMQRSYSEEVGRAAVLSREGLVAMAEMEKSTGIDGFGVQMASAMDKFGASVLTSRDLVKETVDIAQGMGVNSAKAAEMTAKSLHLAQKFKFKGGAKGLAKMATEALKLRIDMDEMAGVAEKVFRPEGAIEMSAKLQTMGGAFAKMADPMQLMFKARNDMAGFQKDMAAASAEFVEFNAETGMFEVKGGLAADRMREIANMTGQSVKSLTDMAAAQKKIEAVGSLTPINFSDEDDELISGLAKMQKGGEITVQVGEMSKTVDKLTQHDLKMLREKDKSLKETAEQARTAEETLMDIKTSFVQLLIPVAEALKTDFAEPLKNLVNDGDFKDTIRNMVSGIADLVGGITKFVIQNPLKSIGVAIAGIGLFKAAMWVANGMSLGLGFNMVAGGKGPGSLLKNLTSRFGGKQIGGRLFGAAKGAGGVGLKSAAGSVGAIGGGVLAGGMAGYNEYQENKELGMGTGENVARTASKGVAAGLGAWGGAAAGAAIGSVVPVIGTVIGGLIGGAIGAWGGSALGEEIGDAAYGDERRNSASKRAATIPVSDGVVKLGSARFHEDDNFLLASTSKNQLNKSVETLTSAENKGVGGGEMKHKFEKLDINITITGVGISDEMAKAIVDSDAISNGLGTKIQENISKNMNGGIRRLDRTG